ncbi:MAG TPA: formimidoylglutamate deiminase [Aliidongia sp.]|nr:formimidoylglutamate deiminase [Aliidongia sp.]
MTQALGKLYFPRALTAQGWAEQVLVTVSDGAIAMIETGVEPPPEAVRHRGTALPGIGNLHSHAFQRGMAGLSERGGPSDDHFWSWREVMYRFLAVLTPDDVEAIAALAYMEMLEAGFTAVAEFHYLHHDIDGRPYDAAGELAGRIAAAAADTGIGLTLLPVFYAHGGFGGAAPSPGQRRFVASLDLYAELVEAAREAVRPLPDARVGIAPHSLRAATPDEMRRLQTIAGDGVIHLHIAEQSQEVADSVAVLGARPVEWLLDHAPVDRRWCLVHATQMNETETTALARSGAVAGLCPVTEANLGDGIFPADAYLAAGGKAGIGTDSNIAISVTGELRALDYAQRLRDRARNRLAPQGGSSGRRLFELAASGGAQALGRNIGTLAAGARADIVVLDPDNAALIGRSGDRLLDSWIFAATDRAVDTVYVGGERVVSAGRHWARASILEGWRRTAARLGDALR